MKRTAPKGRLRLHQSTCTVDKTGQLNSSILTCLNYLYLKYIIPLLYVESLIKKLFKLIHFNLF